MAIYRLPIDPPYCHARHYLGYTDDDRLADRIAAPKAGQGARLTQAVVVAGYTLTVVKVWRGGSRSLQPTLKQRKNVPRALCPVCSGACAPDYEVASLVPGCVIWDEWDAIWNAHFQAEDCVPLPYSRRKL